MTEIGPTGKFPDGTLNEHDKGVVQVSIGIVKGRVIIEFGELVG